MFLYAAIAIIVTIMQTSHIKINIAYGAVKVRLFALLFFMWQDDHGTMG
jgi:hypothetical protein